MAITTLDALTPDPTNRRTHSARNLDMLAASLRDVGASRSIVVDERGTILAGNGVVEAASRVGLSRVQVVDVDGETVVAVRRTGLSDEQKRALAMYDNRTAELAAWDWGQLREDVDAGLSLEPFFTPDELAKGFSTKPGRTDPDAVPELRATEIRRGDLFELGKHRLLCGDSTDSTDVARIMADARAGLVLTDPPYPQEFAHVWIALGELARRVAKDDAFLVTLCGHYQLPLVLDTLRTGGWEFYWLAIASNQNQPIMHGYSVKCAFKPCLVCRTGHPKPRRIWIDDFALRAKSADWEASQGVHKWGQATALWYEPLDALCGVGEWIYEPFLGGGTTIIAAELHGSSVVSLEIEPGYCQVAIDRWEAFTGLRAVKVGDA